MALTNGTVTDSTTPREAASTGQLFYQYSTIDKSKRAFRLLILRGGTGHDVDCEIVESTLDSNTLPYEAVSYTWGPNFTAETVNINGKKMPVTFNLGLILRDLRFADADRVIWVDAICIDQQDATEKGHQVGQMQDIFALAKRVLFCIARPTNYTDLFLSSLERIQSENQHIDLDDDSGIGACWNTQTAIARHHLKSSAKPSENLLSVQLEAMILLQRQGLEWILGQPWFHRVWILQEVANARDALVYCGQKSVSAAVFALGARLLGYSLPDDRRRTVDEVLKLMPGHGRKTPSQDLFTLFRRFGRANASVERDRIYALFGICEDKQIQTHIPPDYNKSEQEVVIDTIAYICHCEVSVIATTPYKSIAHFLSDLDSDRFGNTSLSNFLSSKNHKGALSVLQHHGNSISVTPSMLIMATNDTMMREGVMSQLLKQHNADTLLSGQAGSKPLLFASEHGYDAVVRQMLEKGAFVEARDSREDNDKRKHITPLLLAAMNGHETVVKVLLEKGANMSRHYRRKGTPLAWATRNGHSSVVQLLVEKGSDVEDDSLERRTPLSWAVSKGHEAIVRLLLKHGADPTRKEPSKDDTPLSRAAEKGRKVIVRVILESRTKFDESCIKFALICAVRAAQKSPGSLLLGAMASADVLDVLDAMTESYWEADDRREDFDTVVMMLCAKGAYFRESSNPLVTAAVVGNERMVRLFLNCGAKVDYIGTRSMSVLGGDYSGTALAFAIRNGREDVVELLLAEGAYLEARDSHKQTPLFVAARSGHENIVKMLLARGADIETRDSFDQTPLCLAAKVGREDCVRVLLENGANTESKNDRGQTPLFVAARNGHENITKMLLATGAGTEIGNDDHNTLLLVTAEAGHANVALALLENGANIEVRERKKRTPLLLAAAHGLENTVRVLLEKGGDIEAKDLFGQTPLHLAAENGHGNTVRLLLENGADIKVVSEHGKQTALELAAQNGHEIIVRALLENGADIKVVSEHGKQTALELAAQISHEIIVKALLEYGADIGARAYKNQTPLHLAAENGHENIVRVLVENGADITVRDRNNQTALSLAAHNGCRNSVRVLLENGADIEVRDSYDHTPLYLAAESGHENIVRLLLENGADIKVVSEHGKQTPLHLAASGGYKNVVKVLLENGADIEAKDWQGRTPLTMAANNRQKDVVTLLLESGAKQTSMTRHKDGT